MSRILLAAVLLSGLCACGDPGGRAFFPIGIFGVNDPAALAGLRRDGFNAVQTYAQDPAALSALAEAAKKSGIKLLAYPQGFMASSAPVRGFPLAAWYLVDERERHGYPPVAGPLALLLAHC